MSRPHNSKRHTRFIAVRGGRCHKTGKDRYRDRVEAELALADVVWNIRRSLVEPKRSYHCNFCNGYHLTSQDKRTEEIAHSA